MTLLTQTGARGAAQRKQGHYGATTVIALLATSILAASAHAQSVDSTDKNGSQKSNFKAEASVGILSDSNISVPSIDVTTGRKDAAITTKLKLKYKSDVSENTSVNFGYNLSSRLFTSLTNFDLLTNSLSAGAAHDFSAFKLGASYRFTNAQLGRKNFLDINQIGGFASKSLTPNVLFRTDYSYSKLNFKNQTARDVKRYDLTGDLYYFMNESRTYVVVGGKLRSDHAVGAEFDYSGAGGSVNFSHRFDVGERELRFRAGVDFENRDYKSITPSIGVIRNDDRLKIKTSLEVPLYSRLYLLGAIEFDNFTSNLPSSDYHQTLINASLGWRF